MRKLSGRVWISIITVVFLVLVIVLSHKEIIHAWHLMSRVNIWILLLLIPVQFVSYFAAGEMMFSYLRQQQKVSNLSDIYMTRLALEMNFVNHVLPSGGVSGVSYMGWRLKQFGIPVSKSTTAQLVRMVAAFASFMTLLVASVIAMAYDGNLNRWIAGISLVLVIFLFAALVGVVYLLNHEKRYAKLCHSVVWIVNRFVRTVSLGRRRRVITSAPMLQFFHEVQRDYHQIIDNKKVLIIPYVWGLVFCVTEVAMFWITFSALGDSVNPAPLVIAYGLAGVAGFFMVTPGGAGLYEAIMVSFLAAAGISPQLSIAGIVLTRVVLMLGTILTGYTFYQQAITKYGKQSSSIKRQ